MIGKITVLAPLLATVEAENGTIVLSGVLLTLLVMHLTSKLGGNVELVFGEVGLKMNKGAIRLEIAPLFNKLR